MRNSRRRQDLNHLARAPQALPCGRAAGTQSFDPCGTPSPGKHAGNEQGITLLTELFGYTGERQDAWTGHSEQAGQTGQTGQIGVVSLRARWLHPHYGRFLSPDPYAGALDRPLSQNDYAYAEGNPSSRVDRTGLYRGESQFHGNAYG